MFLRFGSCREGECLRSIIQGDAGPLRSVICRRGASRGTALLNEASGRGTGRRLTVLPQLRAGGLAPGDAPAGLKAGRRSSLPRISARRGPAAGRSTRWNCCTRRPVLRSIQPGSRLRFTTLPPA